MNSDRSKCMMAGLGRYELILLEKQFVGRVKEYIQKNDIITEQQESISEGIYREKIRRMKKIPQAEETYTGRSDV